MSILLRLRLFLQNLNCRSKCCEVQKEDHHDIIINIPPHVFTETDRLVQRPTDSPININIRTK
jgi:hypothetical protein